MSGCMIVSSHAEYEVPPPKAIFATKTKTLTKMIAIRLPKLKLELKYSKNKTI